MKRFILLLALFVGLLFPNVIQAQCDATVNGPFTLTSQEPSNCQIYPASIWTLPLPADKMSHLATYSSTVVAGMSSQNKNGASPLVPIVQQITPGSADIKSTPVFYGQASDPIWTINGPCGHSCGTMGDRHYIIGTYWHIPSGAHWTNHNDDSIDSFFSVWDQTNNMILGLYKGSSAPDTFTPSGCGSTIMTACVMDMTFAGGSQEIKTATGANVYQIAQSTPESLHSAPQALLIRSAELLAGQINHAVYLNVDCENTGTVFPAPLVGVGQALTCSAFGHSGLSSLRPYHGDLFFLDYSDSDINAMSVTDYEKTIFKALAHYGGYIGDTNADITFEVQRQESMQANYDALGYADNESLTTAAMNVPILNYVLNTEGLGHSADGTSAAKFTVDMTANSTNFWSHLHIANECVAKGMAGLAGGCYTSPITCLTDQTLGWHDCGTGTKMTNLTDTACGGTCGAGAASGGPYAYSGGFWDSLRSRMIVWGGGHTDNYTNMQFGFTLTGTPASSKVTSPTAHGCATNFGVVGYSCDGGVTPNDRHTYSIIAYDPAHDGMIVNGGAQSTIGQTNGDWWFFSYASGTYTYLNPITTCVNVSASGPCFEVAQGNGWDPNNTLNNFSNNGDGVLAFDPNTNLIWGATVDGMIETYNLSTHTLTQVSASNLVGNSTCGYNYSIGTIDPFRKRFWLDAHACGVLGYVDISSNAAANVFHVLNPQPSGGILGGSPGMEYDPVSHHIVMWNGGNSILDYNPDTNTSTTRTFSNGPPTGAAEEAGRTFKRFSYMYGPGNTALSTCGECFAVNNGGAIDEFVLRLSSGAPDTTPPTDPSSLTATAISSSQINLGWTVSTDAGGVGGYNIEQCSGGGCSNFAQINTTAANSYSVSGLSASTSYSYRVRAFDTSGNLSGYSNTATASTQAADVTAPTNPSSLTATAVSSSQINLSWTASTDAVGVTRYRVERCSTGGCSSFAEIAQINGAPPVTTYSDNGLAGSTSYSYRVRANDIAGNLSSYSNTATDTTQMAPATTTLVDFLGNTNGGHGATYTDTYGLTGWATTFSDFYADEVTRGGVSGMTEFYTGTQGYNYQGVQTATAPRNFVPGEIITAYWYNNDANPITFTPKVSFTCGTRAFLCDGAHPSFDMSPLTLAAGASGTASYTVDGTSTGTFSLVNVLSQAAGQQVLILDKIVLQPSGSTDSTPPTNPSSLAASNPNGSQSQLNLNWTASTDASGVTSYLIERCTGGACSNFAQVGSVSGAPPQTTFLDTGLATSTTYSYRVRASDAAGNLSGYSNTSMATTNSNSDAMPPTAPTSLSAQVISYRQINLAWTASTDNVGVTQYNVEQCSGAGCVNFTLSGAVTGTPPVTTYSGVIFATGSTYSLRVRANDAAGNFSPYSNVVTATTLNPGPLQVGNDKPYLTLAAAYAAAGNGDTIEVDYNTSTIAGVTQDIAKCITIRGVGPPGTRPSFAWDGGSHNHTVANGGTGTNPIPNDQGIFRIFPNCVQPQLVTLDTIECSGAYGASGNAACVRYANTTDVALINMNAHDNEAGVLGGNTLTDTLTTTIQNSIFNNNGAPDGSEHNVYIGEQANLIFQYNEDINANGGHLLKSRARFNKVIANFISCQGAEACSESPVDFSCGGDIYFIGNIVELGANSSFHGMLQSAEEAGPNCGGGYSPTNRVYIINNTFFNYFGGGNFFDVKSVGGPPFTFANQNNILAGGGTLYAGSAPTVASNNNTTATSADFVDSANGNYNLVMGASEINAGTALGAANGISLVPTTIYVDPAASAARQVNAPIDIGAYELPVAAGNQPPKSNRGHMRR